MKFSTRLEQRRSKRSSCLSYISQKGTVMARHMRGEVAPTVNKDRALQQVKSLGATSHKKGLLLVLNHAALSKVNAGSVALWVTRPDTVLKAEATNQQRERARGFRKSLRRGPRLNHWRSAAADSNKIWLKQSCGEHQLSTVTL